MPQPGRIVYDLHIYTSEYDAMGCMMAWTASRTHFLLNVRRVSSLAVFVTFGTGKQICDANRILRYSLFIFVVAVVVTSRGFRAYDMQNLSKIGHGQTGVSVLILKRIYFTLYFSTIPTCGSTMVVPVLYIFAYRHFRVIKWPTTATHAQPLIHRHTSQAAPTFKSIITYHALCAGGYCSHVWFHIVHN